VDAMASDGKGHPFGKELPRAGMSHFPGGGSVAATPREGTADPSFRGVAQKALEGGPMEVGRFPRGGEYIFATKGAKWP